MKFSKDDMDEKVTVHPSDEVQSNPIKSLWPLFSKISGLSLLLSDK